MIVKMNLDGVIEKTYGSRVFKGSNAVTEIALFAPFDPRSTVIINFTLPDGTEIPGIMTFADFSVEDHYNMWVYKLRQNVTSMEGRVTLSFEVRAYVDETEVTTTAETHIYIEKSSSTTFLDEVDEFFELANEALTRSQQALNLNQATNEALEIEVERNNEQDNAIAAINQTLTSQQNVINEHGNKLEILSELPSRMNRAEQNIGILNNQVNALPEPQDILTKQNYTMPEGYAPTQPHHLADKKYVDDVVEAMSGTNPEHFVTHAQLDEALYKPDFIDLTIDEPVYHITEATLDSPKEIQLIEGNTIEVDGQLLPVKNPVIESVGKNLFDGELELGRYDWNTGEKVSDSSTIRNKNYIRIKPNTEYIINDDAANRHVIWCYDENYNFLYFITTFIATGRFITGESVHYINFRCLISDGYSLDTKFMLNEGTTPLPYEPYRSTKLAINGEYHQWDKIINDGGVYWDEVGSGKITFDGSEDWGTVTDQHNEVTEYYYVILSKDIGVKYVTSEYEIVNAIAPGFEASNRNRVWSTETTDEVFTFDEWNDTQVAFRIRIAKERLNGRTIDEYLSQNPLTVVYQLATPTRKPTSITKAGDPDFSQGNTIYLHSDTEAIPTVHAKVAMDIAGQVDQLTKDSHSKSKKLHDHGQRIKTNEIAIEQLETDIQNTFNHVTYTISNGHLIFYRKDGTTKVIDLPLEMIIESGRFDEETNTIILTMANQQTIEIPVGAVVTDISEALHDVEENLNLTQAELNQLQTDINNSITAIQNELNNKITLNTGYSAIRKEYAKGTILPVYAAGNRDIGAPRYIKVRYSGGSPSIPIGFEETDSSDPDRLDGVWTCIGQCGENYYLFQRLS